MKTEEDEAFDDLARKQGAWGGGFKAKRAMAADKLQDGKCKLCVDGCIACDARAQPAQEPVAVHQFHLMYSADWHDGHPDPKDGHGPYETRTLYTAPPKREWVGLTDEEIDEGNKQSWVSKQAWQSAVWWASEKLKEKNNG